MEKKNIRRPSYAVKNNFAVSKRIRTFAFRNTPFRPHENHVTEGALLLYNIHYFHYYPHAGFLFVELRGTLTFTFCSDAEITLRTPRPRKRIPQEKIYKIYEI